MTYVFIVFGVVIVLLGGATAYEHYQNGKLETRLGSAETTISTMKTALEGIQNAQKSRNTTDRTVRELPPAAVVDKLR